jgi:nicotinate-nucleotide adenylyltransferase
LNKPQRIGVFGGTFDPIHNVHLAMAKAAQDHARLDLVLFVVSARPPHKAGEFVASAENRYAMVQAAVNGNPAMAASRIELDRQGPSYTVDTLANLQTEYPQADLYLILGEDSVADLPQWKNFKAIMERATILAIPRPGHFDVPETVRAHYDRVPFEPREESSTDIRLRLEQGKTLDGRLPSATAALIRKNNIYHVDT